MKKVLSIYTQVHVHVLNINSLINLSPLRYTTNPIVTSSVIAMGPGRMRCQMVHLCIKYHPDLINARNVLHNTKMFCYVPILMDYKRQKVPSSLGRLSGESNTSVKTISIGTVCPENGVERLLENLDKSYAVATTNEVNTNLSSFLDHTCKLTKRIEKYIEGVQGRLDKISTLNLENKLKGNLLLRQGSLTVKFNNIPYSSS